MHPDDFDALQNKLILSKNKTFGDAMSTNTADRASIEKIKAEYEKLYAELLSRQIEAYREKQVLQY